MNSKPSLNRFFSAFLLAAAVSAGTVFCPITAFSIPVDTAAVLLFCTLAALVCALIFSLKKAWIALCVLALVLAAAMYLEWDRLFAAFSVALQAVTKQYAIPFDSISETVLVPNQPDGAGATAYFCLLGGFFTLVTAWVVSHRLSIWIVAAVSLPQLIVCLVIVETAPVWWAVLLLTAALCLLLLTQTLRYHAGAPADRLTLRLLLPVLLLVGLLAAAVSPSTYQRAEWSDSMQSKLSKTIDKLSFFRMNKETGHLELVSPFTPSTLGSRVWDSSVTKVNLNRVGPQSKTGLHVMQIYSGIDAIYHLRADSLATYTSNSWTALDKSVYEGAAIPPGVLLSGSTDSSAVLQFKTDMKASICYTPYKPTKLPENAEVMEDAYVTNPDQLVEYSVSFAAGGHSADLSKSYEDFVYANYLIVPDETKNALSGILSGIPISSGNTVDANAKLIGDYVENSAAYDLNTPRVPDGEDFAVWFLTQSDTGYCVHYATAAAVLLRCAGIPARYVTGYLVDAKAGQWTDVTEDDAHAWVEYYVNGVGWQVLDPTPPDTSSQTGGQPAAAETKKPEQTKPDVPETTPEAAPQQTEGETASSAASAAGAPAGTKSGSIWKWVWLLLLVLAVVFGWRLVVMSVRNAMLRKGSANRRAVSCYRHLLWLSRLAGEPEQESLREIALKARFSQHKIGEEELAQLTARIDELTGTLLSTPNKWKKLIYRMLYGLG